MGANSKIEWTDHTFNPWWGCTKQSPACKNCYAERWANRLGMKIWGDDAPRRLFDAKHFEEPLRWNESAKKKNRIETVFCMSMGDILEDRPELVDFRAKTFALFEQTDNLVWLVLTKLPHHFQRPGIWPFWKTPPKNVVVMTTVEATAYLWRARTLCTVPAVARAISYEPALGPVDFSPYLSGDRIDWVIAGGETGPGFRPPHPSWFRSVRNQCLNAGKWFFFKQWGGDQNSRLLDGVEWNQTPLMDRPEAKKPPVQETLFEIAPLPR